MEACRFEHGVLGGVRQHASGACRSYLILHRDVMSWYEEHAHNSAVLRGVSLLEDVAQRATEEELRSCVLNVFFLVLGLTVLGPKC